ncbi:MAG: propionyl-coenzyme A carboxylase alpha polypeptide, partial [Mesorhizobium sp.]
MRSVTPPSALPGISPARGEIELSFTLSPFADVGWLLATRTLLISPLAGEMAGRPEGGG